jgi:hypothetical protein
MLYGSTRRRLCDHSATWSALLATARISWMRRPLGVRPRIPAAQFTAAQVCTSHTWCQGHEKAPRAVHAVSLPPCRTLCVSGSRSHDHLSLLQSLFSPLYFCADATLHCTTSTGPDPPHSTHHIRFPFSHSDLGHHTSSSSN